MASGIPEYIDLETTYQCSKHFTLKHPHPGSIFIFQLSDYVKVLLNKMTGMTTLNINSHHPHKLFHIASKLVSELNIKDYFLMFTNFIYTCPQGSQMLTNKNKTKQSKNKNTGQQVAVK